MVMVPPTVSVPAATLKRLAVLLVEPAVIVRELVMLSELLPLILS
jgi:hypothetical protein